MEKEIAALVAQEDYSGAAKVHSLLIWLQEEQAGLRQSRKESLERSRELLAQHQEAKNAEKMAECLMRNDHVGAIHAAAGQGSPLTTPRVDPVVHVEQNYTDADTKGGRGSDEHRADHDGGPHR